ncbi:beta strand repeat-containing protein [Oceanicola sp. S124]|uniref:beta strand repeat-containing protein n=1 Tax=Oceanicola sp. S124 TaxID=1042378 RepID=UPI0002559F37|nr:autotransporter outer membrane beta-barrel domain-containing protein [Oceanicola sp. S124]
MNKMLTRVSVLALMAVPFGTAAQADCVDSAGTFTCTTGTGIDDSNLDGATINVLPGEVISDSGDVFRVDDDNTFNIGEGGATGGTVSTTGGMGLRGDNGNTANVHGSINASDRGIDFDDDATVTVYADGEITSDDQDAIEVEDDFVIVNSGTISGEVGIDGGSSDDITASITNNGLIEGTDDDAISVGDGVSITNNALAEITGDSNGIEGDDNLSIDNYGSIFGKSNGINAEDDLHLENFATGSISTDGDIINAGDDAYIYNAGSMSSDDDGIVLDDDFTIENVAGGSITAEDVAIRVDDGDEDDSTVDIANAGTIRSYSDDAIVGDDDLEILNNQDGEILSDEGTAIVLGNTTIVSNEDNAEIRGDDYGIDAGDDLIVDNSGAAEITGGDGAIRAEDDLDVSNTGTASIWSNGAFAIQMNNGEIENDAAITAANGSAIYITDANSDGSTITNEENGTISGGQHAIEVESGADHDVVIENLGSLIGGTAAILLADGDDEITLRYGSSVEGDILTGAGNDLLTLETLDVDGTIDMGDGTDELVIVEGIEAGFLAFSDSVEIDNADDFDNVLFTGDYLLVADEAVFASYDTMTSRAAYVLSTSALGNDAPGWFASVTGFSGEGNETGGNLLIGRNAESVGAFLAFGRSESETGLNSASRRGVTLGVKGFVPLGSASLTGMAYLGRGESEFAGPATITGDGEQDDTVIGFAARFATVPGDAAPLGFSAEFGVARYSNDAMTVSGLAGATFETRDTTASYLSVEAELETALSGGVTLRPFIGATVLFADASDVTMSLGGESTTFSTGADDTLSMLRIGTEIAGTGGWNAKLEGQFDNDGNTTGLISFGMSF